MASVMDFLRPYDSQASVNHAFAYYIPGSDIVP